MKNIREEFDEKQLLDQGIAYRYAFNTAVSIIIAEYVLTGILSVKIGPYALFALALFVPGVVYELVVIFRDAHDPLNVNNGPFAGKFFLWSGIILSVLVTINASIRAVNGKPNFLENGGITDRVGSLIIALSCLTIGVADQIKRKQDKKACPDE